MTTTVFWVFLTTFLVTFVWLRKVARAPISNSILDSGLMALAIITAGRVWGLI